jgi:hypothetical protein
LLSLTEPFPRRTSWNRYSNRSRKRKKNYDDIGMGSEIVSRKQILAAFPFAADQHKAALQPGARRRRNSIGSDL